MPLGTFSGQFQQRFACVRGHGPRQLHGELCGVDAAWRLVHGWPIPAPCGGGSSDEPKDQEQDDVCRMFARWAAWLHFGIRGDAVHLVSFLLLGIDMNPRCVRQFVVLPCSTCTVSSIPRKQDRPSERLVRPTLWRVLFETRAFAQGVGAKRLDGRTVACANRTPVFVQGSDLRTVHRSSRYG